MNIYSQYKYIFFKKYLFYEKCIRVKNTQNVVSKKLCTYTFFDTVIIICDMLEKHIKLCCFLQNRDSQLQPFCVTG